MEEEVKEAVEEEHTERDLKLCLGKQWDCSATDFAFLVLFLLFPESCGSDLVLLC